MNWTKISKEASLSKDFIREHIQDVDWEEISKRKGLTESFITEHEDYVNWTYISSVQDLSEEFMEKYQFRIHWGYIAVYQNLSEEFIEKYSEQLDWKWITQYQTLSFLFCKKHINNISLEDLRDNEKSSFSEEEWKELQRLRKEIQMYNFNKNFVTNEKEGKGLLRSMVQQDDSCSTQTISFARARNNR